MPEIGSTTFSQIDNNNTGPLPGITGSDAVSTVDNSIRSLMGAIKREYDYSHITATATGAVNAYVLTYAAAPVALYVGMEFGFIANLSCTGAATINVNALGAIAVMKDVSGVLTALVSGDIPAGQYLKVSYNGVSFVWINWQGAIPTIPTVPSLASTTEVLTGTDAAKTATPDAISSLWKQGADVASAAITVIGEGGYFNVTGVTTITDIDFATDKAGRKAWLKFNASLILTHNAITLILPGGANITTAAGDTACFVSEGTDNVRCVSYNKAAGAAVLAAKQATTSGTSKDFTGIPAGAKRITVMFAAVSTNGISSLLVQIGDSGGIETTGYSSASTFQGTSNATSSSGFLATSTLAAANTYSGTLVLTLQDESNTWIASGQVFAPQTANYIHNSVGVKATSAELDRVRITTVSGDTFDAGAVNILYE